MTEAGVLRGEGELTLCGDPDLGGVPRGGVARIGGVASRLLTPSGVALPELGCGLRDLSSLSKSPLVVSFSSFTEMVGSLSLSITVWSSSSPDFMLLLLAFSRL